MEAVLTGQYEHVVVKHEYHLLHCTYMFRKFHRATMSKRRYYDGIIRSYMHMEHCENILMEQRDGELLVKLDTGIRTKFPDCMQVDEGIAGVA